MKSLLKIRNRIRDAIREYDEIVTPILKFIWCFLCFYSIDRLFGYSELFSQIPVIFLLSVIFAVFNDKFMFFVVGIIFTMNVYEVSLEAAIMFLVIYIAMYCMYIRFFPTFGYVILLSMICCMCGVQYLIPLVVGMVAGIGGALPAAFGLLIYHFSLAVAELDKMNKSLTAPEGVEVFKYIIENVLKNKEMILMAIVFAITIILVHIIRKLSFNYSAYVAILAGALCNIGASVVVASAFKIEANVPTVIMGTFFGLILAAIIQVFRGILDYKHTENVQFEDDDYYYYVKAVPKIDPEKKKHNSPKRLMRKKPSERRPMEPGRERTSERPEKSSENEGESVADKAPERKKRVEFPGEAPGADEAYDKASSRREAPAKNKGGRSQGSGRPAGRRESGRPAGRRESGRPQGSGKDGSK